MSDGTTYTTASSDGYTATSNAETAEEITTGLGDAESKGDTPEAPPKEAPPKKVPKALSEAASKLGKKGGEAAAKAKQEARSAPDESTVTDGDAAGTDRAGVEEPEEAEKPLGRSREDSRARMLELAREHKETKQRLEAEQRERERVTAELHRYQRGEVRPEAPVPVAPKADDDPRPVAADFDNHEEFTVQLSRWGARQEHKEFERKATIERQAQIYAHNVETQWVLHQDRIKEAVAADPEFVQRVSPEIWALRPTSELNPGEQVGPTNVIADLVLKSEVEAALLLHFTEHPDEFQRIASLRTPGEILQAMARLEGKLDRGDAATTALSVKPEVSMAKPPVRPVTGSPGTADSMPREDAPYEEHKRYWDARDAKARAGR